ncbi:DUF3040 domain-containing protein [Rhodococcus sp. TAF43]|uniref:DUF3040 domain-containing protein n=1 Tax=unclassified Rhodococcus (in: high G+C Gram-positive bacteria) TaxID=192944 RepID=UPI000E0C6E5D|nr:MULTISPECIES: DUF3040 domain-containing protein [unclassified Rhodococcus (in: high G+C Gram-positive bacteria)]QKT12043.1 DUF3040 domain-containing protein [Rhodococcus sp. W8901]RDI32602.1 DUF3040 family protein [Rhodococcus sp. AG1013]
MPLSEHEQRMLDQIESALYAEDPKFASTVRGGRMRAPAGKRRLQAVALFALGLVLLIAGVALDVLWLGGFPIVSVIGFVVMFGAGVLFLFGGGKGHLAAVPDGDDPSGEGPGARGSHPRKPHGGKKSGGGFSSRMEDRFRRRFEQE